MTPRPIEKIKIPKEPYVPSYSDVSDIERYICDPYERGIQAERLAEMFLDLINTVNQLVEQRSFARELLDLFDEYLKHAKNPDINQFIAWLRKEKGY